jgi:hypothetical protein
MATSGFRDVLVSPIGDDLNHAGDIVTADKYARLVMAPRNMTLEYSKGGCRYEHHVKPWAVDFTYRGNTYSDHSPSSQLHRCDLFDRHRIDWNFRRSQLALVMQGRQGDCATAAS